MASASRWMIPEEQRYEGLSHLYLTLWKQLDLLSGNAKWLEIRPLNQLELQTQAENALADLKPSLPESDALAIMIEKDFRRAQTFLEGTAEIDGWNAEVFKDYLRELGLRYAQASDELL